MITSQILTKLEEAKSEAEQVAREIYYAMTFLEDGNPARANLNQALRLLGVKKPEDVGLSNTVLVRRNRNA